MIKIATIVGARPQFIKCAPVSREIRKEFREILIHTGQHYDPNMSQAFFDELNIPEPDYNLGIGSGSHGEQTGKMLIEIEKVLLAEKPDLLLIYGDTNSTLAGALAASKLHIPVAHVEAGLRSFNRKMPEEINRILSDSISEYLFAPTQTAVDHLKYEGLEEKTFFVGDVMYDSFLYNLKKAQKLDILDRMKVRSKEYILTTIHRPQNTDDFSHLARLLITLDKLGKQIVFPIHPRTRNLMRQNGIKSDFDNLQLINPVSYLEMIALEKNAETIITDSGGVQKEAYFAKTPCLVLRTETEWVELVENGWAWISGNDYDKIPGLLQKLKKIQPSEEKIFGDGNASKQIVEILKSGK